MNVGKIFEKDFKESVPKDVYFVRMNDAASSFGQDSSKVRFSTANPYDFFMVCEKFIAIELKTTDKPSITVQRDKKEAVKQIKKNQIDGLTNAASFNGVTAGFVLDFRGSGTYWLNIKNFNIFLIENDKKSISEKDVIKYNGIAISKTIKRKHYKYDIKEMINNILKEVC